MLKKYYSCLLVSVLVQIDRMKVPIEQDRSWFARVQGMKKSPISRGPLHCARHRAELGYFAVVTNLIPCAASIASTSARLYDFWSGAVTVFGALAARVGMLVTSKL